MDMHGGVEGRWLTYAELAALRHIDKHSALKLALRKRWQRRKNNHGTMQCLVPSEWLVPFGPETPPAVLPATLPATPDRAVEAAVASLTEARKQAEQALDRERARADRAEAKADQERLRADQ